MTLRRRSFGKKVLIFLGLLFLGLFTVFAQLLYMANKTENKKLKLESYILVTITLSQIIVITCATTLAIIIFFLVYFYANIRTIVLFPRYIRDLEEIEEMYYRIKLKKAEEKRLKNQERLTRIENDNKKTEEVDVKVEVNKANVENSTKLKVNVNIALEKELVRLGIDAQTANTIIKQRGVEGYRDLNDFAKRSNLSPHILIKIKDNLLFESEVENNIDRSIDLD